MHDTHPQKVASYGRPIAGHGVGILHIGSAYALFPGNVQHARTFPFPVLYEQVEVESLDHLFAGAPDIEGRLIEACKTLVRRGARTIVGACASFGYYQKAISAQINVPVFLSVLLQVPFIQQALVGGYLGVICASASSMNERIYAQCGITESDGLVIAEMRGRPEFDRFLSAAEPVDFDALEQEVLAAANEILETSQDVQAFLLQCSDLPPFAPALQRAFGLPIFDAGLLVRWAHSASDYSVPLS